MPSQGPRGKREGLRNIRSQGGEMKGASRENKIDASGIQHRACAVHQRDPAMFTKGREEAAVLLFITVVNGREP